MSGTFSGSIEQAGRLRPARAPFGQAGTEHCKPVKAVAQCLLSFGRALGLGVVDSIEERLPAAAGGAPDLEARLGARSRELRGALARYFQQRLRDSQDVEDLVQEVFLRIVKRGNCEALEHFEGYVFQTAASVLIDRARRNKARASGLHVSFEPDLHSEPTEGPDQALIGRESLRSVGAILLELPERTRQVFVLRRLEELSYKEISVRLGLSISAAEKHMLRATRHLAVRTGSDQ